VAVEKGTAPAHREHGDGGQEIEHAEQPLLSKAEPNRSRFQLLTPAAALAGDNISFDYDTVGLDIATKLKAHAESIRARIRKSTEDIIEIGRDLLAAKEHVKRGQFDSWVEHQVGIPRRTAYAYIRVARLYEKSATVALLPLATVHRLAAPSAPPTVVDIVITKAAAGEIVPDAVVREMINEAKSLAAKERGESSTKVAGSPKPTDGPLEPVAAQTPPDGGTPPPDDPTDVPATKAAFRTPPSAARAREEIKIAIRNWGSYLDDAGVAAVIAEIDKVRARAKPAASPNQH
jgi:hypothetical protein